MISLLILLSSIHDEFFPIQMTRFLRDYSQSHRLADMKRVSTEVMFHLFDHGERKSV
jgi:hypothetical protein